MVFRKSWKVWSIRYEKSFEIFRQPSIRTDILPKCSVGCPWRSGNWVAGSKSSKYGQGFTSKWDVKCLMSTLKLVAETSSCQISSWSKPLDYLAVFRCFSWSFRRCTDHSHFVIFSFIVKTARTIARHRLRSSRTKFVCRFPGFCRSFASGKIPMIQNTSFYKKLYSNKNEKQSTKIHNISRPD